MKSVGTNPSGRRSIQTRVVLLVGIGMLASLTVLGSVSALYLESLQGQLLAERQLLARTLADHADYVVKSDLELLQRVSSAPRLDLTDNDPEPERLAVKDAYLRSRVFDCVFLVDRQGRLVAQEPLGAGSIPPPGNQAAAIDEAIRTGKPTVSGLVGGRGGHLYEFVPLRDWQGAVAGLAGGEINPASPRFADILSPVRLGETGAADLIDRHGAVLASGDSGRVYQTDGKAAAIWTALASGQPAILTANGSGNGEIVAAAALKSAPWAISVRQREREAFAQVIALRGQLLWLGAGLLALALVFAWGAARSVRKPIVVLTGAAERIAGGDLARPIPPLADDEVGRLGRAFEDMRVALKTSLDSVARANEELERRVEERTRQLEEAYRQLRKRDESRGQLLRKVISAQEDERKRIARELHDETSQTLSALAMGLETALASFPSDMSRQRLAEAKALTLRTLEELHRVIFDLRPSVLDDLGLLSAIRWYAERNLEPLGIAVHFELSGPERRFPPEIETALFRVVQEAITNIARHSGADTALIQVALKDDSLSIEVEDDGNGFDPATIGLSGPPERGLGLLGIRERVELLGGQVVIDAAPDQGVRIALTVPIPPELSYA